MAKNKSKTATELVAEQSKESGLQTVNKYLNMDYLPESRSEFREAWVRMTQFQNRMNGLFAWKRGQMLAHMKRTNVVGDPENYGKKLIVEEASALGEGESTLYKYIEVYEAHPESDPEGINRLKLLDISKAKAASTVKDPKEREKLEMEIITSNLTSKEVNARVSELKKKEKPTSSNKEKKKPKYKADNLSGKMLSAFKKAAENMEDCMSLEPTLKTLASDQEQTTDEQFGQVVDDVRELERHLIKIQAMCKKGTELVKYIESIIA